ncbi:hypothetical protein RND71_003537 [Anisodus tanguticus]|uniref:Uncharacterized protein n=1 Tax=Anisodus tanguticus TaxID=243964 RepID=A0AAE1SYT4_9SOLA|nr:hypothetical protein RND71_003537 [Anisodus tanguticus]
MPLAAPQASQEYEFEFMPNPEFNASFSQQTNQQSSQPISEASGSSKSKRKAKDKPVAPLKRSTQNSVAPSSAIIDENEDQGELKDEDDQSILRPKVISEAKTRLPTQEDVATTN